MARSRGRGPSLRRSSGGRSRRAASSAERPSRWGYIHLKREVAGTIGQRFPRVVRIDIKGTSTNFDVRRFSEERAATYGPDDKLFFEFKCSNNQCEHGARDPSGYYFTDKIVEALEAGQNQFQIETGCHGWNSWKYVGMAHCGNLLDAQVTVTYREGS